MFTLVLPLLVVSEAFYNYPKKVLFLYSGPKYDANYAKSEYEYATKNIPSTCKSLMSEEYITNDDCVAQLNSLLPYVYVKATDINKALSEVSADTEVLSIRFAGYDNIDLNNLKNKKKVFFHYSPKDDKPDYVKETITFNGDIKDKVSYLRIDFSILKLTSDLIVDVLEWRYSSLVDTNYKIKTKLFALTENTNNEGIKILDFVETEQFGFYQGFGYYQTIEKKTYQKSVITYHTDSWEFAYYKNGKKYEELKLPYEKASMFNPLFDIPKVEIILDNNAEPRKFPPINISVMQFSSPDPIQRESIYFGKIDIKCIGWDRIKQEMRPNVTLTIDSKMFTYEPKLMDLNITVEEAYEYQTTNGGNSGDPNDNPSNGKNKNKTGMIVGIVVGVVVVVAVVIIVVIVVIKKKKKSDQKSDEENASA